MDTYYHATTVDNLRNLLDSGSINSLRHIAKSDPDKPLDVEITPLPVQVRMSAANAYGRLKALKNADKVHFTKGGYLPNYGDVVIAKRLGPSLRRRVALNTIPEEFETTRRVSLRDADIYVPGDQLDSLRERYRGYRLRHAS